MALITIPNNHVAVRPMDAEVKLLLEPYVRQCPFRSERPENLHATIVYARSPIPERLIQPGNVYTAVIAGAKIWYDPYMEIKDVVILLDSLDLIERANQILSESNVQSVYDTYVPHMTLAYDIPNTNHRYRWWTNDVIERFNTRYKGTVIRFSEEFLEDSAGNVPVRGEEKLPVKPVL